MNILSAVSSVTTIYPRFLIVKIALWLAIINCYKYPETIQISLCGCAGFMTFPSKDVMMYFQSIKGPYRTCRRIVFFLPPSLTIRVYPFILKGLFFATPLKCSTEIESLQKKILENFRKNFFLSLLVPWNKYITEAHALCSSGNHLHPLPPASSATIANIGEASICDRQRERVCR